MKKRPSGILTGLFALVGVTVVFWTPDGLSQVPPQRISRQDVSQQETSRQKQTRQNPLRTVQPVPQAGLIRQTSLQSEEMPFPTGTNPPVSHPSVSNSSVTSLPRTGAVGSAEPTLARPLAESGIQALPVDSSALSNTYTNVPVANAPITNAPVANDNPFLISTYEESASAAPTGEAQVLETTTNTSPYSDESVSPLSSADPFAAQQPSAAVPMDSFPAIPSAEVPSTGVLSSESLSLTAQPPTSQPFDAMQSGTLSRSASASQAGTGSPGASNLEGLQTPHLTLQKVYPDEVIIDQPAVLKTIIQNVGNSAAKNVTITDRVPQGTQLISTIPENPSVSPDGELCWSVGNLDPNVQLVIEMKVMPIREGEIGSVASVNYSGESSGRIAVTRPLLKVDVKAPAEIKLGETAQVEIAISNPGTATATNIVLVETVPDGLYHKDGMVLENKAITTLKPKETKRLMLSLTCTGAGLLENQIVVTADGNLKVENKTTIRAMAPILKLQITGSQKRFLERESDYKLLVANEGNASAHNVGLELILPPAVQFISTNQSGEYDPSTHRVHWALAELPPQEAGEIELRVMPTQKGDHTLRFTGAGENNLMAETTLPVVIDGIPAITFEVAGDSNLVEIGKDASYEIRVINRGTKAAENVKVQVTLAENMSFVKAEGARYQTSGRTVQFETIPQLAPKSENVYKFSARCQVEGEQRIRVQVISNDLASPIAKEESTRVFR